MKLAKVTARPARLGFERLEDRSVPSGVEVVSGDPKDWPMYNHDAAGSRHNTAETRLSPATVGDLGVRWNFPTHGPVAGTPAVVNDRVYAADAAGYVYALDRDGHPLWETQLSIGPTFGYVKLSSSVLVTNRTVIVGDLSGQLHGLDVDTGAVRWTTRPNDHPFAAIWGSPTMVGHNVAVGVSSVEEFYAPFLPAGYHPSFRGSLALLDPATGGIVWQTYTISDAESAAGSSGSPIWSSPTYDPGTNTIFATTGNNYSQPTQGTSDAFMAFDATTGAVKWTNQRTADDEWTFLFGDTSEEHPDFDIGDSPQVYRVGGRTLVSAGQKSGFLHVLDAATGAEVSAPLQLAPDGTVGGLFADSAYADGVIYANGTDWPGLLAGSPPNRGILSAVAADGSHELWHFDTPGSPNMSGVAVANGVVYFQSLFGTFYALDARTGVPLAQVFTGSFTSGPAVSRGQVYVGTGDAAFTFLTGQPIGPGSIMALGLPDRAKPSAAESVVATAGKAPSPAATPRLSISDERMNEGNSGATVFLFPVTLSAPSAGVVTVGSATADGTATAATWSGLFNDYQATAGTLTFAPGEAQKTIAVTVYGDRLREDDETFVVSLDGALGADLLDGVGLGTIRNDGDKGVTVG